MPNQIRVKNIFQKLVIDTLEGVVGRILNTKLLKRRKSDFLNSPEDLKRWKFPRYLKTMDKKIYVVFVKKNIVYAVFLYKKSLSYVKALKDLLFVSN